MDEEQSGMSKKETLLRLYRYLFDYKKEVALVLAIMAGTIAVSMVTPLLIERAVNVYVARGDRAGLFRLGLLAGVLFLLFLAGTKARSTHLSPPISGVSMI